MRGRLWRCTNPHLSQDTKRRLTAKLMLARRKKGAALRANDPAGIEAARSAVDLAKRMLGERGEVWWADGAPDWNRHLAKTTPYAEWFNTLDKD